MQCIKAVAFAVLASALAATTASAEVHLTIQNGRVSLTAKDATLRQILAEWAAVGHTTIVNGDRVPGGPISIQLTNVPEEEALETLVRALSGYVAAPRSHAAANLTRFDLIFVMPTIAPITAPAVAAGPPPPVYPQPGMAPPFMPSPSQPIPGVTDDQEDERAPNMRGPVFNTFPQPQIVNPMQQTGPTNVPGMVAPIQGPLVLPQPNPFATPGAPNMPAAYPGAPTTPFGGVAVPGMMVQPAPQPGQQGQPVKRPGPGGNN